MSGPSRITHINHPTLDHCRELIGIVAPELVGDVPLYTLVQPPEFPKLERTAAVATRHADAGLAASLAAAGEWRGPGNTIMFCDHDFIDLGLALHEAAHLLPLMPAPKPPRVSDEGLIAPNAHWHAYADLLRGEAETDLAAIMPRWIVGDHGLQFVRRCLHLAHRAWHAGFDVPIWQMSFAGDQYDLSVDGEYRKAIGDEPVRLRDASFAEIEAEPMPAEFLDLFSADVQRWLDAHPGTRWTHAKLAS